MDRLEGCFQIEHYHSYTCCTVRAVIEIVQVGSKLAGTYRFERNDNGEVTWIDWPTRDGDAFGEERRESVHRGPDGKPWRWRLSLAGTYCFARPLEDGRVGLARHEDAKYFDDYLERIQVAPAGEPYRHVTRTLKSMIDYEGSTDPRVVEVRKTLVSYIAAALETHPVLRSTIPDAARLVRGELVDLRELHEATGREATREERAYFDEVREAWDPRLRELVFPEAPPATAPLPVVEAKRELPVAETLPHEQEPVEAVRAQVITDEVARVQVVTDEVGPMKRVFAVPHLKRSAALLVNAAKALDAAQNTDRGELLVVVRDGATTNGTCAIGSSFDTAMVAEAVNAVPFDSLAQVENAWQALRAGLPAFLRELRTDPRAPVRPLRQTDLGAALEAWYAETFQSSSTSERQGLVAAAIKAGCRFIGGFDAMTPSNTKARLAVLAGSTVAMLVYYIGDGP